MNIKKTVVMTSLAAFAAFSLPISSFASGNNTVLAASSENVHKKHESTEIIDVNGEKIEVKRVEQNGIVEMSFTLKGEEHRATFNKKTKTLVLNGEVIRLPFDNINSNVPTPLGTTDKDGLVTPLGTADKDGLITPFGDEDEIQWRYIGKSYDDTEVAKMSAEAACLAIAAATMSTYSIVWAALAFYFDKLDTIYYTTWYYVDPDDYLHAMYYTEVFEDEDREDKIEDWTTYYQDEDLIDWAD